MRDAPDPYPVRKPMQHTPPLRINASDAWYFITICAAERGGTPFTDHAAAILDAARHYHRAGKWRLSLFLIMPDHIHAIVHFPPTSGRAASPFAAAIDATTNIALNPDCGAQGKQPSVARQPKAARPTNIGGTARPTNIDGAARPTGIDGTARPTGMAKTIAGWKHFLTRTAHLSFQRDFFDTRLRDDEHYAEKWGYIVRNPVTRGLVASPREWPHVIAFNRETGDELPHR